MSHNKLASAPKQEVDAWGAPTAEATNSNWDNPWGTPEATVESPKRKGLVKRLGEKVTASSFVQNRNLRKGMDTLTKMQDDEFKPLGEKRNFKPGSKEAMQVSTMEQDAWNEAHARNEEVDVEAEIAKETAHIEGLIRMQQEEVARRREAYLNVQNDNTRADLDAAQSELKQYELRLQDKKLKSAADPRLTKAQARVDLTSTVNETYRDQTKEENGW